MMQQRCAKAGGDLITSELKADLTSDDAC